MDWLKGQKYRKHPNLRKSIVLGFDFPLSQSIERGIDMIEAFKIGISWDLYNHGENL
jgi:hypothetical protein